jgi:hypothetical protein
VIHTGNCFLQPFITVCILEGGDAIGWIISVSVAGNRVGMFIDLMRPNLLQPALWLVRREATDDYPGGRPFSFDRCIGIGLPLDIGTHSPFEVRILCGIRSRTFSGLRLQRARRSRRTMVYLGAEAFPNLHTRDFVLESGFLSVGPVSALIE